jgi:basic amino acid/polyamine antiporter, APA family
LSKLERNIGLLALVLYGVGDILGSGIYGLVGKAAGEMGYAAWLGFVTSMIAAGLTGLSYASIGSRYPRAGGAAYVTYRAFAKPFLSYAIGLAVLFSGLTSMATACRVFSGYFTGLVTFVPLTGGIILFACVVAFVVFWGMRESMIMNAVCTIIELSGLLIVIAVGLPYLGSANYLDATTAVNTSGDISFSLILTGAVLTFYSFVGFEDILNVSEEVKNPERNLPIGLISAVAISSVIYVTISLVAVSVIPPMELAASKQPLVDVVGKAAPAFPTAIFSIISMFAVANTALLNYVMGSRLLYGMATQKLLPESLARIHSKRRTPHVATIVILVVLLTLALSGDISTLAKSTSVLLLICFSVVNLSLVVLQRRKSEPKGLFEVPSIIPLFGSIVCLTMLCYAKTNELLLAGGIFILITVLYFMKKPHPDAVAAIES